MAQEEAAKVHSAAVDSTNEGKTVKGGTLDGVSDEKKPTMTDVAPDKPLASTDPSDKKAASEAANGVESVDSEATDKIASGDPSSMSATIIDMDIFGQLLEMDDEEDREFSKEIVWNYFDQAETTFGKMDAALAEKDLPELSTLGHFLKGSSAAVGVIKVRDSCEYMQHYGKKADKDGITTLSGEEALKKLQTTLQDVKVEYKEAEAALRKFYADSE